MNWNSNEPQARTTVAQRPSWFIWLLAFCLIAFTFAIIFGGGIR